MLHGLPAFAAPEGAGSTATSGGETSPPANMLDAAGLAPAQPDATGQTPEAEEKPSPAPSEPASPSPAASEVYVPEGLPDDLKGATDKETIDKLLAARPAPPSAPADYEFELSETTKSLVGETADDPAVDIFRQVAHEAGLSNEQAGKVFDRFFSQAVDAGLVSAPADFEKELLALAPPDEKDPSRQKARASERVQRALDGLHGLKNRGVLSDDDMAMAQGFFDSANGIELFEKLSGQMREPGVQSGGQPAGTVMSDGDIARLKQDQRYNSLGSSYDPEYRKYVDAQAKAAFEARKKQK